MNEAGSVIENKVEGPHQILRVEVSSDDYKKHWKDDTDRFKWLFEELDRKLPDGEIKKAIQLANEERLAKESNGGHITQPAIVPEASKYAFRCLLRNSNNVPKNLYPDSGLDKTTDSFFQLGIDSPDIESVRNILPATIFTKYAFPSPYRIDKSDVSIIAIYDNSTPFVLPPKPEDTDVVVMNLPGNKFRSHISHISIEEANAKNYPTLRDTYIGQVQIHFTKTK